MSDDIVTQLRNHIAITTRMHYAKDGFPEPVFVHGPSPICQEAADEIERLRKERDEARRRTNSILTEIDCRIEHGAESNGHLEVLRDMFKENTDE